MPYVDNFMEDGAIHGLYQKFDLNKILATVGAIGFNDNVTFNKKVIFDKDTAGVATITALTNQVDIKFVNAYTTTPIINFSLVAESDDVTYIEDGHKAYLSHITPEGFSITLPTLAIRDFSFNWMAFSTSEANITKSEYLMPTPTIEIMPTLMLTPTEVASPSAVPTAEL